MAVTQEDKLKVQKRIRLWLVSPGGDKLEDVRRQYHHIPKPTFFRWLKECKAENPNAGRDRAIAEARELGGEPAAVRAMMPVPVSPADVKSVSPLNAVALIHECIGLGREVVDYCRGADGKIRNVKGALSASAHMRASVDTLARVVERVNDAQRINDILDMMITEIAKESPEAAQRILARMQAILQSTGL